jgi:uncharacterized protein
MDLVCYSFVLLLRGPRAHEYEGEELDRLQAAHLGHLDAMRERGVLLVAGPFGEQEDEAFRGFCLYRTDLEETRELAESDPSVQAGRMRVDVMEWWTQRGAVEFPLAADFGADGSPVAEGP